MRLFLITLFSLLLSAGLSAADLAGTWELTGRMAPRGLN